MKELSTNRTCRKCATPTWHRVSARVRTDVLLASPKVPYDAMRQTHQVTHRWPPALSKRQLQSRQVQLGHRRSWSGSSEAKITSWGQHDRGASTWWMLWLCMMNFKFWIWWVHPCIKKTYNIPWNWFWPCIDTIVDLKTFQWIMNCKSPWCFNNPGVCYDDLVLGEHHQSTTHLWW